MKILAVNGSPRGQQGNTDKILQPFLEGARAAGAEAETVYLKEKKINHCSGCFTCWIKTPGVCIHRDDMPGLLEKIREADALIFATPLYVYTVSGLMKDFMDRIIPLVQPYIVKRGSQYIHPKRHGEAWPKKVVLVSNCGFPERHHFSGLVETFRTYTSGPDMDFAAPLLCTGGEILSMPEAQGAVRWYIEAALAAGKEFVEDGRVSEKTQALLDTDLADPEIYSEMANMYWESVLAE